MRLMSPVLGTATVVLSAMATPLPAQNLPAIPAPQTQGPATFSCGGIGEASSKAMLAARKDYPLSLLFATASGEYMPLVNLAIKDAKGASALTVPSTGPICLISRAGRIAASRRGAEVRTTDCPGGQFALHQGAISRCDLRVEDGKKWSCCGRIPDAIPFSMASARLLEALEDLAACLRVAARCSPADFPKWSDAPPNHFAEIERLWSDIRPWLRRDLAAADEVNEGLGAMISAFETGDAVRVREIAEGLSGMDLVGLR